MHQLIFGFVCALVGAALAIIFALPAAVSHFTKLRYRQGCEAMVPALREWHQYGLRQGAHLVSAALAASDHDLLKAAGREFLRANPEPAKPRPKPVEYDLVMGEIG